MNDQQKNILIGIFVLVAMVVAISIILFMEPQIGDGKQVLQVRFANITGLSTGTQVKLAGKVVGEVTRIEIIKDARQLPPGPQNQIYLYQLTMHIDSMVKLYQSDEITIKTTGLLGEKSVAIIPHPPKPGHDEIPVSKDEILYAQSTDSVEIALNNIANMSGQISKTVKNVDTWFTENQTGLTNALESFGGAMREVEEAVATINREQLIDSTKVAIDAFKDNMDLVHNALQEIEDNAMVAKFDFILDNIAEVSESMSTDGTQTLANIRSITDSIAAGKGVLGKLIKSDDLYLRFSSIMSKADTLMNDINHYGLLFQYSKDWQRSRTRRANQLAALDTPQEFKTYFETEVDTITTALERLTIVLDKAEQPEERARIMGSPKFKKDFLELLTTVSQLLDSLKLYNEEMVSQPANQMPEPRPKPQQAGKIRCSQ